MRGSHRLSIALAVVIGLAVIFGVLLVGVVIGSSPATRGSLRGVVPPGVDKLIGGSGSFSLQEEVLQELQDSYYKKIDPSALQTDSIRGMLSGLDDGYTDYFTPQEYAEFQEHTQGLYSGVGMAVEMKTELVTVVSTFKDSPAGTAGIKSGDIIVKVNGVPTKGMTLDSVVQKIKGPEGTKVTLEVYRPPAGPDGSQAESTEPGQLPAGGATKQLELTRRSIDLPVVESTIVQAGNRKVADLRFLAFSEDSSARLRAAVEAAVEKEGVSAVILDLRSNGGGLLAEAIDVSSIFLPKDALVVTTEGLHSPRKVYRAGGHTVTDLPLYVLTDRFSASASEIVAGALKDNDRATLVGETTFGKGLVQSLEPLSNGGALKVTTAVYLTPDGEDINKKGIAPDVKAPDDPDTPKVDETLAKALALITAGGSTGAGGSR